MVVCLSLSLLILSALGCYLQPCSVLTDFLLLRETTRVSLIHGRYSKDCVDRHRCTNYTSCFEPRGRTVTLSKPSIILSAYAIAIADTATMSLTNTRSKEAPHGTPVCVSNLLSVSCSPTLE
uniref:Putative secreted protein n=1 Tax=Anopheles marajoara TaxID=58244 RepID=A0A2M4C8B0_9DIPT